MTRPARRARARRSLLAGGLLPALFAAAPPARAADVEVESYSVYRSFEAPSLSEEDVFLQPFSQAFRMVAAERSENRRLSFETYFRGTGQHTPTSPGFRDGSRVYYAYLDVARGRRHPTELRLGRQATAAGGELIAFDGARIRYRGPWKVGFELFGGTTISGYGALTAVDTEDGGPRAAGGVTVGASTFLTGIVGSQARLGFRRVDRGNGVDRQDVVADLSQRIGRFRLYGEAEYSTVLSALSEGLGGTSIYLGRGSFVDVEAFHYLPTFGAQSIFNVFALEPYDELRLRVRSTQKGGRLGLWARLGHAIYGTAGASENVSLGATFRPIPRLGVSGRTYYSGGYLGSRVGVGGDARMRLIADKLDVTVGGTFANARNDLFGQNLGNFASLYTGMSWIVPDRADLSLMAEYYGDDFSSGDPRVTASFRFRFGTAQSRRSAIGTDSRKVNP